MHKKIKLHFQKYMFYYIFGIIIFILISNLTIDLYKSLKENKRLENDYSIYDSSIEKAYYINPSLFKFDKNGIAIVKMDDLLEPISNGEETYSFGLDPQTKDLDQCVGYLIVKKTNDKFDIDYTHICDMIDY